MRTINLYIRYKGPSFISEMMEEREERKNRNEID
jgi:hypothetical protein